MGQSSLYGSEEQIGIRSSRWQWCFKRTLDIVLSLYLLILFSSPLIIISILIKVTSPGPVFFAQQRLGYQGKPIRIYKFRTMVPNAEELKGTLRQLNEMEGPAFKMKNDPRVTRFGKWLRKTNLDEFPQFWNVLVGDMSIVGPRPLPIDEALQCTGWRQNRMSVKPGITGLWQISARYEVSFDEWMRMDIEYIERFSCWLDLKIIFLTCLEMVKMRGM